MDERDSPNDITAISALGEPVRRRLYEYVAGAHRAVGRDEAAAATRIGRPLAAFHLDRLVRDGLLATEYRRLTGRSGPGAGRPSKLYRRASRDVGVSLPRREYQIAAHLFAAALEGGPGGSSEDAPPRALLEAAHAYGRKLADEVEQAGAVEVAEADSAGIPGADASGLGAVGGSADVASSRDRLLGALERLGFEPLETGALVRLRNCPFDALARDHRGLTCPANLALLESLVERLEPAARPVPMPEDGFCCVAIELGGRPASPEGSATAEA